MRDRMLSWRRRENAALDPDVGPIEELLEAAAARHSAGAWQGRALHALNICACCTLDESPDWMIYSTKSGVGWRRLPIKLPEREVVHAPLEAGGHAAPAQVLAWLRAEASDPWGRHKWLASAIGVVAAVTAFASFTPMGLWWSGEVYFQAHRDDFAALAEHFDSPAFTESPEAREYGGAKLPPLLALVSADGRASYDGAATFVAVWFGIPDNAGGFFYSRTSPEDYDMYGLACHQPEQVAENWWACGMR